jgi:MoxR-like ATPase
MEFIDPEQGLEADLQPKGNMLATKHLFEPEDIDAINAAIACRRPLLVTGDPGTGKSQLARAAAARLQCAFVSFVVDSRTESRDLMWRFDAVARLADAQLGRALSSDAKALRKQLALEHYVHPGPLWWGFDWEGAKKQAESIAKRLFDDKDLEEQTPEQWDNGESSKGCVVLIDEIDKAESTVPNGLLEALGDGCFLPEGHRERVKVEGVPPLVIITSNNERVLPDAFRRRCLEHDLSLPDEREAFIRALVKRGKAHFPKLDREVTTEDKEHGFLELAAAKVADDRRYAQDNHHRPLPGLAEYIDLLRVIAAQGKTAEQQEQLLDRVRPYVVAKGFKPAS